MIREFERHKEACRFAIISVLLTGSCYLIYHFHIAQQSDLAFTHVFYIPIILASYWWKRKGIVVSVFLSVFMISSYFFSHGHDIYPDIHRAIMFIVVALLVVILRVKAEANEKRIEQLVVQNKLILESAGEGIFGLDLDGNHTFVNPAAAKMLGYEVAELIGRHSHSMLHYSKSDGSIYPESECPIYASLTNGLIYNVENEVFWRKDGSTFPVRYISTPIIEGNKIKGAVLIFRDITERKKAEETIKRVSRQNELILNTAGDGICLMDSEGKIMFANPAAADMCGYQVNELIGAHMHSLLHYSRPDGSPYPWEECPLFNTLMEGATCQIRDEVFWRKNNTNFPVAYKSTPMWDRDTIIGAVITFRDITERKRSEEALMRKSEEEYRRLFEESKDVVFISTPDGRLIDINQAGVELFGYSSKEELLKADIENELNVHLGHRKELLKMLDEKGYVMDYELHMKKKNGDILIVLETSTAFSDETGRVRSYRGILRDITHQRKLERQIMQAQKMELMGHVARGSIACDFNNILTAIMGYGSILQMRMEKDNPLRAYVRQILSSLERAENLTNQILNFSKQQIIDRRPVKINEIIVAIEKLLSRLIGEDIELQISLSPEDLTIRADIGQIEQVLMKLAANARHAMPHGGKLVIKTESVVMDDELMRTCGCSKEGPYVVLTVSDTGEGMDEKTREKIFEPFFKTMEVGKNTGLELSIISRIIKHHNGCINAYSEPGEGTSFSIYLPLIGEKAEDKMTLGQPDAIGGTETVLLIEGDSEVRTMVSGLLRHFGYTVIETMDGDDAVEIFREHKDNIQIVILEVITLKNIGLAVYNKIIQIKPEIQVIITSGHPADVIKKNEIIEEGVKFISKPFAPSELLKTIRKVLQQ